MVNKCFNFTFIEYRQQISLHYMSYKRDGLIIKYYRRSLE